MPELPEVEVLARHLRTAITGRTLRSITLPRPKTCRPSSRRQMQHALVGRRLLTVERRAKYLLFHFAPIGRERLPLLLLAHLGMTGRIYLQPRPATLPKHLAALLTLDHGQLVFEDSRFFGRLTLDLTPLNRLGPEPLSEDFTLARFKAALSRSRQPVKTRLLDQTTLAGVGNIYASEALFRARLHPGTPSDQLTDPQTAALRRAIRAVLREAITWGSTVPLNWAGDGPRNRIFYYGTAPGNSATYEERLRVYDRTDEPCLRCRTPIQRLAQAGRSTFFCPRCQRH